jgi:hypothetical protein
MDLRNIESYNGYCYNVSATREAPQEWRGTVDIRRQLEDSTIEAVVKHMDTPGQFAAECEARQAARKYAKAMIDREAPGLHV